MTSQGITYTPTPVADFTGTDWVCVGWMTTADAKRYVWSLALSGVPTRVRRDATDPRRWHIAVQGGMRNNPSAWLVTLRDPAPSPCPGNGRMAHIQAD